tara:strand:- start:1397 stop:1879 length:483 start_codon:yes stop_codon:yes gene_type:complete
MKKRGISPLISSVLLIAFVITLFVVISNWIQTGVVEETTDKVDEKLTDQLDCLSTTLDIADVCVNDISSAASIELSVDNLGDTSISGVSVRVLGTGGSLGTFEFTAGSAVPPLGRILSRSAGTQTLSGTVDTPNKIEVYPLIGGKLCRDQVETVTSITAC